MDKQLYCTWLTERQHELLKILSKRTGKPVTHFVRMAIDLTLQRYDHEPVQLELPFEDL